MRHASGAGCSSSPTSLTAWTASTRASRSAGAGWSERDVDDAAGAVGVLGQEAREARPAVEPLEQADGHAAVQRADHRLVLGDRVAIWAVAEHVAHVGAIAGVALGGEPEGRQAVVERLGDRAIASVGRDLAPDLLTGGLDVLKTAARPGRAGQPPAELLEGLRA